MHFTGDKTQIAKTRPCQEFSASLYVSEIADGHDFSVFIFAVDNVLPVKIEAMGVNMRPQGMR